MLVIRSVLTLTLAGAALALATTPTAAQEAPEKSAAQPAVEDAAEDAREQLGPLPAPMFRDRSERRVRFVGSGGKLMGTEQTDASVAPARAALDALAPYYFEEAPGPETP